MNTRFGVKSRNGALALFVFIVIVCFLVGQIWFAYGTVDHVVATVTKTERVTSGSGEDITAKYLIFTDKETFQNTDSFLYWKFNSSDVHSSLVPGEYRMKVYGWRVPVLSWYRNVVEASKVEIEETTT